MRPMHFMWLECNNSTVGSKPTTYLFLLSPLDSPLSTQEREREREAMALVRQQLMMAFYHRFNYNNTYIHKETTKTNIGSKPIEFFSPISSSSSLSSSLRSKPMSVSAASAGLTTTISNTSQEVSGNVRWGWCCLQGARSEMEDDVVVVRSDSLQEFDFAAVFDGHAGFSSVEFLRNQLYKECVEALKSGLVLVSRKFNVIQEALEKAFETTDTKLLTWLDETGKDKESGSTATALFVGGDMLIISHVGDSSVVLSRSGKAEVLTSPHRPYGSGEVAKEEIKRIKEAGGWVVNGRICGDIAVSRSFGDIRFKRKKNEMLENGVKEGRWTAKFISRVQINGDWVTATPDIYQVSLGPDAEFLLLATDGLWDYMSSSEAVRLVRYQLKQHGNIQSACEALAQAALGKRSQDNVSIIIADLGRTDWLNISMEEKQNVVVEVGQAFGTIGIVSLGIWLSQLLTV